MKELFLKIKGYLSEVGGEARRVTWPTSRECYDSTLVCDKVIQLFIKIVHLGA